MQRTAYLVMILTLVFAAATSAQSNIDSEYKWAWSENCGWTNWQHDAPKPGDGALVAETFLAGFVWGENIGWINLGYGAPADGIHYVNETGEDSGVNLDLETGDLFGMAWGENVGWINFGGGAIAVPPNPARLEGCRFRGFAWGENIGWINLDDAEHFIQVEGIGCDDGDACTESDACSSGECSGVPVVCPEGQVCEETGECVCDPCPTDVDGDNQTGPLDLAVLLACWGPLSGDDCLCLDSNGDDQIGPADLAALLGAWGACL